MIEIIIFGEDRAHEIFLRAFLVRLAVENDVAVRIHVRSATGGHGRMISELKQFLKELKRDQAALPDLFVVARDANCAGYAKRVKEIKVVMGKFEGLAVYAVPDPHIERWLLLDSKAFKEVLGHGCQPPDHKCDRDRYKELLDTAVRDAGIEPLLGGLEFGNDLVRTMNPDHASMVDASFGHLLRDLRAAFQQWQSR